jgi:hypothetical protein
MKPLICVMLSGVLFGTTAAAAGGRIDVKPDHKHGKHQRVRDDGRAGAVEIEVSFSPREMRVLREYYTPRYRSLPPGLQKKLQRGGQLPPGWQKRFETFPGVVERDLAPLPSGYRRGVIDGHAVVYNPRTRVIIAVGVLF